jgi:hypothetical protein
MTLLVPRSYRVNTLKHFRDRTNAYPPELQQTTFLEWRDDKDPEEAVLESNEYLRHFFFALLLTPPFYHKMKLLKPFLSLNFLLTLVSVVSADEPQTTAVLVHGAFADGSSWSRVTQSWKLKVLRL